jgi:peptidoglycan L-alanyl-D-glutamate endopeptidase CwlK
MSRALDDLSPRFKPLAMELVARCVEARIPVVIVDTLRTLDEQKQHLLHGRSWTLHSLHLTGDAIDICPYSVYDAHGDDKLLWDVGDPIWAKLAAIGRGLGLRCGYDWKQKDAGHFEYRDPTGAAA